MRIKRLMSTSVECCGPADTLATAARAMWDHDCGCLPVCTGDGAQRVVGMITDRDICMSALFEGKALHELSVSSAMSEEIQVCSAKDSATDVERLMRGARVRRMPVVDDEGAVIGIISLADLAREADGLRAEAAHGTTNTGIGDTLAAIVGPRVTRPAV